MIIRHLADAIRQQNWFTVGIEILIVVAGIFIGLQVDSWNQARKDKIDEQIIMVRLHNELLLGENLSSRVLGRRLKLLADLKSASDVLFRRNPQNELTIEQCGALGSSHHFNIAILDLSSVAELMSTGRLAIIKNRELLTSLVALQEFKAALTDFISLQANASTDLPAVFPDLIQLESYYDEDMQEVRSRSFCNLNGMWASQGFLNSFSENIDRYDAYLRDGLTPWSQQFDKVHTLVDESLGTSHTHQ